MLTGRIDYPHIILRYPYGRKLIMEEINSGMKLIMGRNE